MQYKFNLTAINTILCDIQQNESLFNGIPVVFSGDFAQTLPMISHGVQADQVAACMQQTPWWQNLIILTLTENMWLCTSINNTAWGQWIAKMSYDPSLHELITLPSMLNQQFTAPSAFLQHVYCLEDLQQASENPEYFRNRAILCAHNDTAAEHNTQILAQLPGQVCKFHSVDTTDANDDSGVHELPVEFLASLNPAGLPPATLELKIEASVMLLWNMHPQVELCNGTHMIITHFHHLCIEASILSEQFADQRHILYRINLTTQEGDYLWIIIRKQFSVHLCFAITINKS